jgi:L-aspartate oxidase
MMGGIVTDLRGRSSLKRLHAVGEVSCTGVHGANRLASNSLLEGLVFAERAASDFVTADPLRSLPRKGEWRVTALMDRGAAQVSADLIREIMWRDVGVVRTATGLQSARRRLRDIGARLPEGATEEENMVQTAQLIVEAALRRKESRGGHYRSDYPRPKSSWRGRHVEL